MSKFLRGCGNSRPGISPSSQRDFISFPPAEHFGDTREHLCQARKDIQGTKLDRTVPAPWCLDGLDLLKFQSGLNPLPGRELRASLTQLTPLQAHREQLLQSVPKGLGCSKLPSTGAVCCLAVTTHSVTEHSPDFRLLNLGLLSHPVLLWKGQLWEQASS